MKLVYYPDPALTAKSEKVTDFDEALWQSLDVMRLIMKQNEGMGLAANQVGICKSFFIMKDKRDQIWDFINPEIIEQSGTQYQQEGCLSFPGVFIQVPRAASVTVKAQDRKGEEFHIIAEDMEAICIQHEIDHIYGIIFLDKATRQQKRIAEAILRRKK